MVKEQLLLLAWVTKVAEIYIEEGFVTANIGSAL